MTTNSQLRIWRKVAAQRVDDLIATVDGMDVCDIDGVVDSLLRVLGGQVPRNGDRPPYAGLFPDGAVQQQRRRAVGGIRVFVDHLNAEDFIAADELMDQLLRSLSQLPPRPRGIPPYESILSFSQTTSPRQLQAWRGLAAQTLGQLIAQIPGEVGDRDSMVDDLLRALGGQGPRPDGRQPYQGLFPDGPAAELRQRAAKGVQIFIQHISADRFVSSDALIDGVMRSLQGLPPRPAGRRPYAGLFPERAANEITLEHLRQIAPHGRDAQLRKFVGPLNATLEEFEINTPLRQAHFLAQVAHESGEFNYVEEIASGAAYEGRSDLGNTQPGDGVRFKGRGLIQITGRFNYQDIGKAIGIDLISNPTRLADDDLAARSAGWFWNRERLNPIADKDDVRLITRIINGGFNGLDDRVKKLAAAKRAFGI
jgi:putative chitinase